MDTFCVFIIRLCVPSVWPSCLVLPSREFQGNVDYLWTFCFGGFHPEEIKRGVEEALGGRFCKPVCEERGRKRADWAPRLKPEHRRRMRMWTEEGEGRRMRGMENVRACSCPATLQSLAPKYSGRAEEKHEGIWVRQHLIEGSLKCSINPRCMDWTLPCISVRSLF